MTWTLSIRFSYSAAASLSNVELMFNCCAEAATTPSYTGCSPTASAMSNCSQRRHPTGDNKMRHAILLATIFLLAHAARGQDSTVTSGVAVRGTVHDSTGAVIPKV